MTVGTLKVRSEPPAPADRGPARRSSLGHDIMWPSDDDLLTGWRRLTADPDTAVEFADLVLPPLLATLTHLFPVSDQQFVVTAAGNAVLAFLKHPARFDPSRSSVRGFLVMIAKRRMSNALASERRHHADRIPWDSVELDAADRNEVEDDPPSFDDPRLQPEIARLSDVERAVFDLMRRGERDSELFATAMGLSERTVEERRAEVKRMKDKILARLKRAAGGDHA